MELTKEYLQKKIAEYLDKAELHRGHAIACHGAAEALELLIKALEAKDDSLQRSKVNRTLH